MVGLGQSEYPTLSVSVTQDTHSNSGQVGPRRCTSWMFVSWEKIHSFSVGCGPRSTWPGDNSRVPFEHVGEPAEKGAGPQEAGLLSLAAPLDGGGFLTSLGLGFSCNPNTLADTVLCIPRNSVSPCMPSHRGSLDFWNTPAHESTNIDPRAAV